MDKRIFLRVKAYIEKYGMIAPDDTIVAGVSGGADSVCLLFLLHELAQELSFRIIAVHVNHGIREEAAEDAAFVKKLCAELEIPFFLVEEDVRGRAAKEKLSEEEAGRNVRYEAFERVLLSQVSGNGRIAVAHNANDRVETMLFHLFRGTGLAGASGIRPVRDKIIRPLLCLKRSEIEEYLNEKQIGFCIDRTNLEDTYTRNRIRNHILPYAEQEICHGVVEHMWETADLLLETEDYVKKQAQKALERCLSVEDKEKDMKGLTLNAKRLAGEEPLMQRQVILICLERLTKGRKDITSAHVAAICGLLNGQGSKQVSLPYGLTAVREYERLWIGKIKETESSGPKKEWLIDLDDIPAAVCIPGLGEVDFMMFSFEKTQIIPGKSYTKWFDYDRITKSVVFRPRKTGDYLTINGNLSRKSLKDYMIGEKIPKNRRDDLYVLADGSHILWVPGYRISHYYKVSEHTKRILQVRIRGGL